MKAGPAEARRTPPTLPAADRQRVNRKFLNSLQYGVFVWDTHITCPW